MLCFKLRAINNKPVISSSFIIYYQIVICIRFPIWWVFGFKAMKIDTFENQAKPRGTYLLFIMSHFAMIKSRLTSSMHSSYCILISFFFTLLHLSTFVLNSLHKSVDTFCRWPWVHFAEEVKSSQPMDTRSLQLDSMKDLNLSFNVTILAHYTGAYLESNYSVKWYEFLTLTYSLQWYWGEGSSKLSSLQSKTAKIKKSSFWRLPVLDRLFYLDFYFESKYDFKHNF